MKNKMSDADEAFVNVILFSWESSYLFGDYWQIKENHEGIGHGDAIWRDFRWMMRDEVCQNVTRDYERDND